MTVRAKRTEIHPVGFDQADVCKSKGWFGITDVGNAGVCKPSHTFSLHVPSEALPMVCSRVGLDHGEHQSVVFIDKGQLCLRLRRRKNMQQGCLLRRSCWCASCRVTCPVHVLGNFLASFDAEGAEKPFSQFSPTFALATLRSVLHRMQIPDAETYRMHDCRRGHAKDLQQSGSSLAEILQAGKWRSPAFMQYLDMNELEHDAVVAAHLENSSDED